MSFFLDGNLVGSYRQLPTGDATYEYNVPVYVNTSLPPGNHTIEIQNGQPNLSKTDSTILLDYIVYTYVLPPTCSPALPEKR